MGKAKKQTQSEIDGVQYRRAKTWQIATTACSSGIGMSFYVLIGLASYVANAGYGILVAVVGIILTATRILDGVTDPIIAFLIDKTNTKFGKIRIWMVLGWVIESMAVFIMYVWASGKGHGIFTFVLLYCIYIIGYTMCNVTAQIIPPVLTNDPKQRPTIGVWTTVYNYFVPIILNMIITMVLLPKYGNEYTVPMLAAACKVCVAVSAVGLIICCIGITPFDKPENFKGVGAASKQEPVKLKDMIALIKSNKALQMFIVAVSSDKLAQQTVSQSIIITLLYGIVLGNMQLSTIISVVAMLPSIAFAIFGARYAGKHGNKEAMVTWTKVCIYITLATLVFFILVPDKKSILAFIPFMVLFMVLTLGLNGAKMCVTTCNNAMMADIIDYELDRSGKYLPAAVTGAYSFVDKIISSLGAVIATASVAVVGYTSTMPQPTDEMTTNIFWLTMAVFYGLPLLGWVFTIWAMQHTPLSKEGMVEVQRRIEARKKEA